MGYMRTVVFFMCCLLTGIVGAQTTVYEFAVNTPSDVEYFHAVTNDTFIINTLNEELLLPAENRIHFISGPIAAGNGLFNTNWNWHFIENTWLLATDGLDMCDGSPSDVEAYLSYWLDTVGFFCPYMARVSQKYELIPTDVATGFGQPDIRVQTFSDQLLVTGLPPEVSVSCINMQGKLMFTGTAGAAPFTLLTANYAPGLYLFRATGKDFSYIFRWVDTGND